MSLPVTVFEDAAWGHFLPLTYGRATFQLVCGMTDLLGRVRRLADRAALWCRPELAPLAAEQTGLQTNAPLAGDTLLLSGRGLWRDLPPYEAGEAAWVGVCGRQIACIRTDAALAARLDAATMLDETRLQQALAGLPRRPLEDRVRLFDWPWQLVLAHPAALSEDWGQHPQAGQHLSAADSGAHLLNADAVRLGRNARILPGAVIDAEDGPVWIGDRVRVNPHVYIQGPAYIGERSVLQPGACIRGGSFLGPMCKIGGEVEGSILHGYANKQHAGFLGHSYVGPWVNIGAGCSNSDLKNTYGTVRVPLNGREVDSGELFVGALIGDHAKLGINLAVPTGAVIGYGSSVAAASCPKYVPSYSWIAAGRQVPYDVDRALEVARQVMARRGRTMGPAEERLMLHIARQAAQIERRPS